jgi:hypothetical protein
MGFAGSGFKKTVAALVRAWSFSAGVHGLTAAATVGILKIKMGGSEHGAIMSETP